MKYPFNTRSLGTLLSKSESSVQHCRGVWCVLTFLFSVCFPFQHLRQANIAGRFVEFFGPGVAQLSVPDRTTIANMCPEYNATVSFFPIDQVTLKHFKQTSESREREREIHQYWWGISVMYVGHKMTHIQYT